MKALTIKGTKRESVGKVSTRALRNADQVPCVIYGGGDTLHFAAKENDFTKLVYTPDVYTVVIKLDNGDSIRAILQDIQFHPVTDRILHIDFYQIFDDREITLDIPVRTVGTPAGVRAGGVLLIMNRSLQVKALPDNMPDFFEIDINDLKIGDMLDISVIEQKDFEILAEENAPICQVRAPRDLIEEEEDDEEEEGEEGEEGTEGEEGAEASEETQE